MPSKGGASPLARLATLAVAGVLYAIPLGLVLGALEQAHARRLAAARQAVRDDLQEIAAHLQRITQPLSHCQDRLDRFVRALRFGREATRQAARALGPWTQVFLFDDQGRQMPMAGTTRGFTRVSETALRLIRASQAGDRRMEAREERMVQTLLGDARAVPRLAQAPGRLLDLASLGQRKFAGFFPTRDRHGARCYVLAVVDRDRLPLPTLAREIVGRFSRRAAGAQAYALTDLAGVASDWFDPGYPRALHDRLRREPEAEGQGWLAVGSVLARQYLIGVAAPCPEPSSWLAAHGVGVVAASLAGFLGLAGLWWSLLRRGLPLRWQILLLVGLAGSGSLVAVLGFAETWLAGREARLIRARRQAADRMLARLDLEYAAFRGRLVEQCRGLGRRLAACRTDAECQRVIGAVTPRWRRWLTILLFDDAGRPRASSYAEVPSTIDLAFGREGLGLIGRISRSAWVARDAQFGGFSNFLPPEVERESPPVRFGAKDFLSHPRELKTVRIGRHAMDRYSEFIEIPGGPRLALSIYLEGDCDKRAFLKGIHRRWRGTTFPASFSFRIYGLPAHDHPVTDGRQTSARVREFRRLQDRLNLTQTALEQRSQFDGQDWLLVGRPGSRLEGFHLVMAVPLAPIQQESRRLAGWFRLLAVLLLIFALTLGSLFLDLVLIPLQRVLEGLDHLAASRFTQRVQARTGDEIEGIAEGINTLLEEMEQVTAAEKVHRQMIPRRPLTVGDLTAAVLVRTPGQIGSDLADLGSTPTGGLAFCLLRQDDRTIGGALGLAGAKTLFRLRSEHDEDDPASLADALSHRLGGGGGTASAAGPLADVEVLVGRWHPGEATLEIAWRGRFLWLGAGRPPQPVGDGAAAGSLRRSLPPGEAVGLAPLTSLAGDRAAAGASALPPLPPAFWEVPADRLAVEGWPLLERWRPELAGHPVSLIRLERHPSYRPGATTAMSRPPDGDMILEMPCR